MKTLLIDIDSLIYIGAFKETLEEGIECVDNRMKQIIEDNKSNKIISFISKGKTFRNDLARTKPYKFNRKGKEKPQWLEFISGYVVEKYNAYLYKGLEADDCVSYFADKIENTTICAIDKDVIGQCVGTHYNYQVAKSGAGWSVKGFKTTTAKEAETFLWIQALAGDSTDGILGIEKVGVKTAEKWLKGVDSKDYPRVVLDKYIEKYGAVEGSCRFAENFRLVYLLKTDEDVKRELGRELKLPVAKQITI